MKLVITFIAALVLPVSAGSDLYKKDIDFFLAEFESKAGHFFEQKGIDWAEVSRWVRSELDGVKTDVEHVRLCARLVARLKDGHARIEGAKVKWPDEREGREWRFPKIGMIWSGERALVASVDPDLGISLGSEVVEIDGVKVKVWLEEKADEWADRRGYSTRQHALHSAAVYGLGGWEGTMFLVKVVLPDGSEVSKEVSCDLGERGAVRLDLRSQLGEIRWLDGRGKVGFAKTSEGNGYIRLIKIPGNPNVS